MTSRWIPTTEEDIVSSIANGTFSENHYLEVKQSANNGSIAATLASLAIDGGTFILGVEEISDAQKNKTLRTKPLPTEGLVERIDQIARNSIEPPLVVRTVVIPSTQEAALGYVVATVLPSPVAPHMAGGKYYGRGEASKHALTDAEVLRYHQRRQQQLDLGAKLLEEEQERDYLPVEQRLAGHIYIVAEPLMPINQELLEELVDNLAVLEIVTQGSDRAPDTNPRPREATNKLARSNGTAFVTYAALGEGRTPNPEARESSVETNLLDIEVTHAGGFRVFLGRGTVQWTPEQNFILDVNAVAYLQHLMEWISRLSDVLNYGGAWTLGVRATGLRGLRSTHAIQGGSTIQSTFAEKYGAMDADRYQKITMATLAEIQDAPNRVVRSLVGNYLRALGTEGHHSLDREAPAKSGGTTGQGRF